MIVILLTYIGREWLFGQLVLIQMHQIYNNGARREKENGRWFCHRLQTGNQEDFGRRSFRRGLRMWGRNETIKMFALKEINKMSLICNVFLFFK